MKSHTGPAPRPDTAEQTLPVRRPFESAGRSHPTTPLSTPAGDMPELGSIDRQRPPVQALGAVPIQRNRKGRKKGGRISRKQLKHIYPDPKVQEELRLKEEARVRALKKKAPVEIPKRLPPVDLEKAPLIEHQTKQEKIARRREQRRRRDRKLAGKSAGPLSEIATSRTKRPLARDQVRDLEDQGHLDPFSIHTTQSTAGEHFSSGKRVLDTVRELTKARRDEEPGPNIPPIAVTRKGGKAFTLDNRRLYAYRRAGVAVPYRLSEGRAAEKDFNRKISTKDGGRSMKITSGSSVPYEPSDIERDPDEE